jgi:hypothetical protein
LTNSLKVRNVMHSWRTTPHDPKVGSEDTVGELFFTEFMSI